MSQSRFQLVYEGPEVGSGSMDVSALGPALLSVGELIKASNFSLNGEQATVNVKVESTFKRGSFIIDLILDQNVKDAAAVVLPALATVPPDQLIRAIFGVAEKIKGVVTGALAIYKAVRGEKPKDTLLGQTNRSIVLVFGNNNRINTDQDSARLYLNDEVRRGLSGTSSPLVREGIDELRVRKDDEVLDSIRREDLPEPVDDPDEAPASSTDPRRPRELLVRVVKPNFDGGRWSFRWGLQVWSGS